jgi:hypothetical protein
MALPTLTNGQKGIRSTMVKLSRVLRGEELESKERRRCKEKDATWKPKGSGTTP